MANEPAAVPKPVQLKAAAAATAEEQDSDRNDKDPEEEEDKRDGGDGTEKSDGSPKKEKSRSRRKRKPADKTDPATPAIDRPARERKVVERYSISPAGRTPTSKAVSIEKGRGTQLKDIPNVAFKLSKKKLDDNLQLLHTLLFGKKAKAHSMKRNIGQFSGYVWSENEEKQRAKVKEKFDKCVKEKLVYLCDVLDIPINKAIIKKEELSVKLLEFLESPHATTDALLADKEQKSQKRKRKVASSKSPSSAEVATETPPKKRKRTPKGEKQKLSTADEDAKVDEEVLHSEDGDDSSEDDEKDVSRKEGESKPQDEDDAPEEPETKGRSSPKEDVEGEESKPEENSKLDKKESPGKSAKSPSKSAKKPSSSKKSAAGVDGASGSQPKSKGTELKKKKGKKESKEEEGVVSKGKSTSKKQSTTPAKIPVKDQGKGKTNKKTKAGPSREEMHAVVVDILKEVDFNTATLSDILRQLGTHFGVDLIHRKAEVKEIITDVINNMTDEEDDGDEGEDDETDDGADADE